MSFAVTLVYTTTGERKVKGVVSQIETAMKAVEHYEKFFSNEGFTRTPAGEQVANSTVAVEFAEV